MGNETRRRLALICCSVAAFALASCGDESSAPSTDEGKCGDSVCTSEQECVDNVCVPKDEGSQDACDNKCTEEQECKDGECVDKPKDPCDECNKDTQQCVEGVCKDLCGGVLCTDEQQCVEGVCKDLCGTEVCAADKICDYALLECVDKPEAYDPCSECTEEEECINKVCVLKDPCANKTCPDGTRCDKDKGGECVEIDPCENVTCGEAQTCIKAVCYDNACLENGVVKDCGEGKVCSKGECVQSGCAGMVCDEGWQCVTSACDANNVCTGVCVETICIDYFCEEGRTCRGGACVDNECLDMTCDEGLICSKGTCTYEICLGKEACSTGKACNSEGNCEFVVPPAISFDEPEDKETDETGDTTTLILHLNNMPTANVTVNCEIVTESPNQEVDLACGDIVFTAENWNVPQEVIITGVEDYKKDGDQLYKVKMTTVSEDLEFVDLVAESVELTNLDKTAPGFVFSKAALTTYEDQTLEADTFTVQLSSIPSHDVYLTLASSNDQEGVATPASLTFTAENWNVPQTVTVKGVDDESQDGSVGYTVFFSPTESEDLDYNEMTPSPIKVTNVDNDVAGIAVTTEEVFVVTEGLTTDVPIRLNTMPKSDVVITVTVSDEKEASVDVKELVLTPENWKQGVILHVAGVRDDVIDGDKPISLTFAVASEDTDYSGIEVMTIEGTVKDADTAELFASMGDAAIVKEGTSDFVTMSMTLSSKPTKRVTVDISVTDDTEIKASKKQIAFNPNAWDSSLDVLISPIDDDIVDGNIKSKVVMKMTSDDKNFNGKIQEFEYTTLDNDVAGIVVNSNSASFPENSGSQVSMGVRLLSQPTADVVVNVTSSDASELSIASGSKLTFTPSNWKNEQTVSVKVVDDSQADSTQTAFAKFDAVSSDPNFNGIKEQSAIYTIIDNEAASVVLTVDSNTIGLGAPTTTAKVVLGVAPTSNVTVTLKTSDAKITSFNPSTVTFTTANWDQPQPVTVTANFEAIETASAAATISAQAAGTNYNVASNNIALNLIKVPEVQNFTYTGGIQTALLPKGRYQLEVWGAEGGTFRSGYPAGRGGYATGILNVASTTTVYIGVGGTTTTTAGGYNGGGASATGRGGGGATHIATATGLLKNLSGNKTSILIVGGAGGGGAGISGYAGAGGGQTGGNGYDSHSGGYAYGGTQTTGGAGASGHTANGMSGSFGMGGASVGEAGGGGGGGWYGGGGSGYCGAANDEGGGGGGSSYLSTSLTNARTIAGSASMPVPQGGTQTGRVGNGYARITLVK